MHGKPACYYDSSNLSGMNMEETIRKWLEDKLEDLELVEKDLKKHVRTFVGIFRLSRQDLVQDIKEEPQYPLEVRKYMDGQYSLEDLRKSVFVFEFMKLTCLKKEEAVRIVDELFTEWNLIALEKLKEEREGLSQKRLVSQPACRSEPVSRSEQETSYTNAFPPLPPKGNKKTPSEPLASIWKQRSPLRSNPSVQSSKSKIGSQDSSSEKASALSNKKIRIGGKENECSPACTEPKKKINKNRDLRSRRESSSSSVQSPKSSAEQQFLEQVRIILKNYLGMNGSCKKASAESSQKKETESQTLQASASTSESKEWFNLNPIQKPEESVWDPDHVTEYPSWAEETASCTTQNRRSASEPHLAKQDQRIDCELPKERTWSHSESTSSSPSPAQATEPSVVDCPSMVSSKHIPENNCNDFTSKTSIHSDSLFLSDSVWSRSRISKEDWPTSLDIRFPQGMNLHPATSVSQMQEKPEKMACGCPSGSGHTVDNTIDHSTQQNLEHCFGMFGQSDGVSHFRGSQAERDCCWWHIEFDSSYESDEEEAAVSSDSESWKLHPQECLSSSFEDKSSTAQKQLELATASDFQNARQQPPMYAMENHSQDTFQNAMSPSLIVRAVDQIFPQRIFHCPWHNQEFQWDIPFRNLHNHLPSMDSVSFPTSCMLTTVQDYSFFDCVSDHCKQQISSDLPCHSFNRQSHNAQMPFPSYPHSFSFLEEATGSDHPQTEPYSKSFMWMQPSQSAGSGEDIGHKLLHGHSVFSAPHHHPVMVDHPRKSEDDIDQYGIRSLVAMLEKNQKNGEDCLKEPQSMFMENDLSGSPDLMVHSSFTVRSQQDSCSCEGACNCPSILPVKFSLGGREEDASGAIHPYKQQRVGQSCMQASQNVMKSASDSKLDDESFHKSAFRKVNSTSYPTLAWPSLLQIAYPFDAPSGPKTTPTCLIQDASDYQLEKIKENSLRVIKPEVMKPEEPEEVAVPDLSILHHPDVYGNRPEEVQAVSSYPCLNFKESKETQTSHGDTESDVLPSLSARPFPKPLYEEKHWKELLPLSAEDEHRDLLFAAMNAQKEGVNFVDVAALEGYDFADFQLLTDTSASLHVPQNQAVYVKDLEKAWLSESYRRLGKNKVRRPLHPNKPCSFYLEGCCYRFDCKFSHDIDTITCQFWEVGQCFKGDLCPFLHGYFGGFSVSDGGEDFDVSKEDFPELTRKDVRLNSAPASKKRKNKKNSIHRLQLPRGT